MFVTVFGWTSLECALCVWFGITLFDALPWPLQAARVVERASAAAVSDSRQPFQAWRVITKCLLKKASRPASNRAGRTWHKTGCATRRRHLGAYGTKISR